MPARKRNAKAVVQIGHPTSRAVSRSGRGKGGRLRVRADIAFVALVGSAFVVAYVIASNPLGNGDAVVPYIVDGQVSVKEWTLDLPFAETVAAAGEAVVLRHTVVEKWRARNVWKPSYLSQKIKQLDGIYENDNRWFGPYYDIRKPLVNLTKRVNSYSTNLSMSGVELFRRILSNESKDFVYFSGEIERLGSWAIDDLLPLDEFISLNPQSTSINVWIGQPRVIAHCHYDGYHNMYVQLFGKKKFTLFRPSQWSFIYPYPFLHPSHAQSQVNLSDTDLDRFPQVQKAHAVEAVIGPGDVLYIPPLWFHYVEALEASISVNVWTDSAQTLQVQKMYQTPVPLFDGISSEKKDLQVLALVIIIKKLINETHTRKLTNSPETFLSNLYDIRYYNLVVSGVLPRTGWSHENKSVCSLLQSLMSDLQTVLKDADSLQKYFRYIRTSVELLPTETREVWLGNLVESLLESVVTAPFVAQVLSESLECLHRF